MKIKCRMTANLGRSWEYEKSMAPYVTAQTGIILKESLFFYVKILKLSDICQTRVIMFQAWQSKSALAGL